MAKPKRKRVNISAVCPTYNSSSYISRTLASLVEQVDAPDEVIFCDDGSNDDTTLILEQWKPLFLERGIDVFINKNDHQGPGAARNCGVKHARYSWIAFLDSDDTWLPNKILTVRKEIEKNPKTSFLLHWETLVQVDGGHSNLEHGTNYRRDISTAAQLYQENFISTSTVTCRREVIESAGGFDHTLPNAQDYDLWLKASDKMNLVIIPIILGECFQTKGSITSRRYGSRYKSRLRVAWRHRAKGGAIGCLLKLGKITFSRQWITSYW